jgi:hypothetical protein
MEVQLVWVTAYQGGWVMVVRRMLGQACMEGFRVCGVWRAGCLVRMRREMCWWEPCLSSTP